MRDAGEQVARDPFAGDEDAGETAAVADPPGAEQRRAPRFTLLIRSAKLVSGDREFLCVVRDASETGVSVRLFHPLPGDGPLSLELPNGDRHGLERVWEADGKAGFRFSEPTSFQRLVEMPSRFAKRGLRVRVEVPCELQAGLRRVPGMIGNLSQQGALVRTPERLSLVQRVTLRAEGLPMVTGRVRWRRGDDYGLSFEDTFQFAELAQLIYRLQNGGGA